MEAEHFNFYPIFLIPLAAASISSSYYFLFGPIIFFHPLLSAILSGSLLFPLCSFFPIIINFPRPPGWSCVHAVKAEQAKFLTYILSEQRAAAEPEIRFFPTYLLFFFPINDNSSHRNFPHTYPPISLQVHAP